MCGSRGSCQQARCRVAQEWFGSGGGAGRRRAGVSRRAPHTRVAKKLLLLLWSSGEALPVGGHTTVPWSTHGAAPQRPQALHFFSGSALPVVGRPTYTLNCGRGGWR